jgi:hypothetical protein
MWRALVGGDGATNNGTTIGPGTPTGALWMCPATNVSRSGRAPGRPLFDQVVHVNSVGALAAYNGPGAPAQARSAAARLPELVSSGRLMSLGSWLENVASLLRRHRAASSCANDCVCHLGRILVLAEPHYRPAGGLEHRGVLEVALAVARDLWPPVGRVRAPIPSAVRRAAVPVAAVDEHPQLAARENDIRPDRPRAPIRIG